MKIFKKAFTLIEAVLTIIVVAIAVSAVPFIVTQVQKSSDFSIMQESLFASMTKMNTIFTYRWDENASDDPSSNNTLFVQAVYTDGDTELDDANNHSGFRIGHIKSNGRKKFFTLEERTATPKSRFGAGKEENETSNSSSYDDIDDFDGEHFTLDISDGGSVDYKRNLDMNISVNYISDEADYSSEDLTFSLNKTPLSNTTNIKLIKIETNTSMSGKDMKFVLYGFVSNLGESDIYHRIK